MSSIDTTRQIADGLERTRGFLNDHGDEQFFFDKKQFIPQRLAATVSDVVPLRVTSDGLLRWYDDGVYREGGDKVAAAIAQEFLQEMTTTSRVNEAVAYIQRDQATRPLSIDPDPTDVIRGRDGIIDLTSGDLTPYTPENATTVQLPWRWRTGSSEHPKIRAFLLEVFDGDEEMVNMVYEIAGYLCLSRNFLRKAILLYGHGNNGKSILLHLLACLLGADNIAAVPLQRLGGDDRFAPSVLVGKLANICGDVGPNSARDMSLFKQLTGGDPIYAERKGQQGFTFLCGAVPVFSANEYPRSPDTERSYINRWMAVELPKSFTDDRAKEAELRALGSDPREMEGFFRTAVQGARDLVERGNFTIPMKVKKATDEYARAIDSVRSWVHDQCNLGSGVDYILYKPTAYTWYKAFCGENNTRPLGRNKFYERMRALPGIGQKQVQGVGWHFTGIQRIPLDVIAQFEETIREEATRA